MNLFKEHNFKRDASNEIRQVRGAWALPATVGDSGSSDIADRTRNFVVNNAVQLGINNQNLDLEVISTINSPSISSTRFQQIHDGLPVYGTEVMVVTDKNDNVVQINLSHAGQRSASAQDEGSHSISAKQAITAAKAAIGDFVPGDKPPTPEKMYFAVGDELRLAFRSIIFSQDPHHEWEVIIDAYTKDELQRRDLLVHMPDGQGLVFDPNPVVTSGDNTLRDPNASGGCGFAGSPLATLEAERVSRTLRDLTLSGGQHSLDGPYVRITERSGSVVSPPTEANANDFNYSSDTADFDAVNVYYHIDTVQRYIRDELGITTAHPNVIDADVRTNTNGGAFFSPSGDYMGFGGSGSCRPERASDGDVALHEYGHAIQHSQVPGWGSGGDAGAMGEGFGDILACVFFAEFGGGFQREVFEDWIFGDVAGLRRVDGTKVYPTDLVGSVHSDGEIWSAALWNIYRAIGGDSIVGADRLAARDELLRTLILSHHRLANNATMPEGGEAFMDENAALEQHRLVNGVDILDSFHDRGILSCAAGSDLKIGQLWSQQNELPNASWQQVEYGQDNWFKCEVTNHGTTTARAFVVLFSFKSPFASPVYPTNFRDNVISGAVGYDLAPGATTTISARWPEGMIPAIPAGSTRRHGCILAEVYNPCDHVAAGVTYIGASGGKLKQRNTDIVDLVPGDIVTYSIDLGNYAIQKPELVRLEVHRDPKFPAAKINFRHNNVRFLKELVGNIKEVKPGRAPVVIDPGRFAGVIPFTRNKVTVLDPTRVEVAAEFGNRAAFNSSRFARSLVLDLAPGSSFEMGDNEDVQALEQIADDAFMQSDASIHESKFGARAELLVGHKVGFPITLKPRKRAVVQMDISAPKNAKPGDSFTTKLMQRTLKGETVGEWDITVNIVEKRG